MLDIRRCCAKGGSAWALQVTKIDDGTRRPRLSAATLDPSLLPLSFISPHPWFF